MSTLREEFEVWFRDVFMNGMDDAGEWDAERNCFVTHQVHMAWKGYQAATERAAKLVEQVGPKDGSLALVTAGFAAAIRSGGEAGL